jgi:hypothetical protein
MMDSRRKLPRQPSFQSRSAMNITLAVTPLISLIAGILILIMPKLLNYIIALYLIIIGVIGLVK